jgi:hypothetical protein
MDFELSAHNDKMLIILCIFPYAQIKCRRFHLAQVWYKKMENWDLKLNMTKMNQKFQMG